MSPIRQCSRINSALYARDNAIAYRSASSESGDRSVGQRMDSIFIRFRVDPCLLLWTEQRSCRSNADIYWVSTVQEAAFLTCLRAFPQMMSNFSQHDLWLDSISTLTQKARQTMGRPRRNAPTI